MATWREQYGRYRKYLTNFVSLYKRRNDIKMFMELLLSLTSIALFSLFAIKPTFLTVAQLIRDIKAKNQTIDQLDQKIQSLSQAQSILVQNKSLIDLLNSAVPTSPNADFYLRQIEGVAKKDGVNVLGVSTGEAAIQGAPDTKTEDFTEGAQGLGVSVSVTGNYESLQNFLADIENLLRPIQIDSTAVSSTSQEIETTTKIVLVITGRIPYLK